jgi:hypothetical protein
LQAAAESAITQLINHSRTKSIAINYDRVGLFSLL